MNRQPDEVAMHLIMETHSGNRRCSSSVTVAREACSTRVSLLPLQSMLDPVHDALSIQDTQEETAFFNLPTTSKHTMSTNLLLSHIPSLQSRANSAPLNPMLSPSNFSTTPQPQDYLHFSVGAEFEIIIKPKTNLIDRKQLPDHNSTTRRVRDASLAILEDVSRHLSAAGMLCLVHDDPDGQVDHTKWNAMMDGSLSKSHCREGHCKGPFF